jgi:acetyl-CoA C-acetyltransferase
MSRRVAIVGVSQTKYEEAKPALDVGELVWEVVGSVVQQTGLRWADQVQDGFGIDAIVSCSEDLWEARTISDAPVHPEMGAFQLPEIKVAADGAQAVYHAVIEILSGHYDVILVVAHRKESQNARNIVENCGLDPIYLRPLGLDYCTAAALQAKRYMNKYSITEEQCAKVVIKNRRNAKRNPYAQAPLDLTVEDVISSTLLAYPIKLLDTKPISDGSCAIILASEEKAKRITNKPVWVKGIGNCYDVHYLGDRELSDCDALVEAAKRAYSLAGINNPRSDIDVAEISEEYSYQELLWSEGLGFCNRGGGGWLIDEGVTYIDGELPVNPSGGVLSGNPSGVAGMARVAEAALQIRGEAGARQINNVKTALAHGVTGPCGQSHCVIILSKK